MNDYDFLWNGQHTRCAETVVTFDDNGEPIASANPKYKPTKCEYAVCRLLGCIEYGTTAVSERAMHILKELIFKAVRRNIL